MHAGVSHLSETEERSLCFHFCFLVGILGTVGGSVCISSLFKKHLNLNLITIPSLKQLPLHAFALWNEASHHSCLQQSTPTIILWKTNTEVDFLNFLLEEVLLVEEEDDGGGCKELVVTDAVEQVQRLMHAILGRKHCANSRSACGVDVCLFLF